MTPPSVSEEMIRALKPCPFCGCMGLNLAFPRVIDGKMAAAVECFTDSCYAKIVAETPQAAVAAWNRRAHLPAGSEAVKIEWRGPFEAFPSTMWEARTPFGSYEIEEVNASDSPAYEVRHFHRIVAVKDGIDQAKAAAHADFERRALSCLAPPSTPPSANVQEVKGIETLREWFGRERYSRDYEYLDANYSEQAERVASFLRSKQAPTVAVPEEAKTRKYVILRKPVAAVLGGVAVELEKAAFYQCRNCRDNGDSDMNCYEEGEIRVGLAGVICDNCWDDTPPEDRDNTAVRVTDLRARAEQREAPSAVVGGGIKPSLDTMTTAAWDTLRHNGWTETPSAKLALHQVACLMAAFGMEVAKGEIGCNWPGCGCCADAACKDAVEQHPDFAAAPTSDGR